LQAHPAGADAAAIVLDTNVVLDWWVFRDPRAATLAAALEGGQVRWHASEAMLDELGRVLARPLGPRWDDRRERVLALEVARHAHLAGPTRPTSDLRCADPDDQKFLDLALGLPARWLVTRDRALLVLARPAASRGLSVVPPERWVSPGPAG